jgi:hypothetical protein
VSNKDRNKKNHKNKDKENKDMRKVAEHRRKEEIKAKSKGE